MSKPDPDKQPLLPLRSAVVLLFAMLIAAAAGGLTYLSASNVAAAVIAGGTAFAGAVIWLDKIIAT